MVEAKRRHERHIRFGKNKTSLTKQVDFQSVVYKIKNLDKPAKDGQFHGDM